MVVRFQFPVMKLAHYWWDLILHSVGQAEPIHFGGEYPSCISSVLSITAQKLRTWNYPEMQPTTQFYTLEPWWYRQKPSNDPARGASVTSIVLIAIEETLLDASTATKQHVC
jgi:hypothetical protein